MNDREQRELAAPVLFTLAGATFGALLINEALAIEGGTTSKHARRKLLGQAIHGLAEMLGILGSIALAVIVVAILALWIVVTVRRIRKLRG